MRFVLLALTLACPALAAPLKVEGDTVVYVKSLPCKVVAPPGASLYYWRVPEGVKATPERNVLTINAAPNGTHKVAVQSVTIDFDAKRVTEDASEVEVNVGLPAPPTPPTPPAPSGLARALKDACAASPGTPAEKADQMAKLAALYRQAPALLDRVKTAGELQSVLLEARKALLPDAALLPVRKVIAEELARVLPSKANEAVGDPARVKATFQAIEAALVEAAR